MTRDSFAARFRNVARERITTVRAALDAGDPDEARREIHSLKGEARVVGFEPIARIAHALETLLAEGAPRAQVERAIALVEHGLELDPSAEPPGMHALLDRGAVDDAPAPSEQLEAIATRAADAFLRVDMQLLAKLTRSISEMRATERSLLALSGQLAELTTEHDPSRARAVLESARRLAFDHRQRCDVVTDDLRRLRMVPLGQLFEPVPRAVAQLAAQLGKRVEVVVVGADVEVDRQILDVVVEPLLHLVRNAIDHGIEAPDVRRASGKPEHGRLTLRARATAAVELEVEDDGAGIDEEAVRARVGAIEGSDSLLDALCQHGFSTRADVSEVSGRGVGLDVVKRRIESVGGRLRLTTERGRGSTFALELPTSTVLATMVCAEVDGARYAISPHDVVQVLDAHATREEMAGGRRIVRVEGRPVPLFDLGVLTEQSPSSRPRAHLIVLRYGERSIAVGIDAFRGTRSVSEQRLDPFLEGIAIVRSVAVFASGELAVALDTAELIRRADGSRELERAPAAPAPAAARGRVLVVDDSELTRDLVVATLRELGLDVLEAVDGAGALAKLEAEEVSLLVTDLDMPVMDGFELIRRVRLSRRSRLPIVVLSTRGDDADVRRASELGADAYLVKSRLEIEQLRRVALRYVERPA